MLDGGNQRLRLGLEDLPGRFGIYIEVWGLSFPQTTCPESAVTYVDNGFVLTRYSLFWLRNGANFVQSFPKDGNRNDDVGLNFIRVQ